MAGWSNNDPNAERENWTYPSAEMFFSRWFSQRYCRDLDAAGRVWCHSWFDHEEACARLEALWIEWERRYSRDPAAWWPLADAVMDRLFDPDGPFAACRNGHSDRLQPLPL